MCTVSILGGRPAVCSIDLTGERFERKKSCCPVKRPLALSYSRPTKEKDSRPEPKGHAKFGKRS